MGDLQKFIRQQFFDNHWTRDVDATTLADEKLRSIDSAFSNIDVKSKLSLLLSLSNLKPNVSPEVDRHVESIFLQALDEENNLVKAVATILHTKQSLNYLNFDISPTNEAFRKNIEKLLKHSHGWKVTTTPLLAECLGENVLSTVKGKPPTKNLHSSGRKQPCGSIERRTERGLGFRCRDKPHTLTLKETYLEKLTDECQRRRVHVPIPGRSFARSDETEDDTDADNSGFLSNHSLRRTPFSNQNRKISGLSSWSCSPEHSARKLNLPWPRPNADLLDKPPNLLTPSERLTARSPAANCRKPSRIKLLDFDELPAFGPKAKQLRKEQMEKERELKRQEREERIKEQKAARQAAKIARLSEKQSLMEAREQPASASWTDVALAPISVAPTSGTPNAEVDPTYDKGTGVLSSLRDKSTFRPSSTTNDRLADDSRPSSFVNSAPDSAGNNLLLSGRSNNASLMVRHPLLSVSSGMNVVQGVVDDDDDDDDDNDGLMMQDMGAGTYQLGISSEFRGFNPSARISLYGSNLSEVPPAQTSYSTVYAPCSLMSTANASYSPYEVCEIPASQTIAPSFTTSLPSTGLSTSGQGMRAGIPAPRTIFTQACVPGTIRFISSTHTGPQVRFVQPVQTRAGGPNRPPSSSIGTTTLTTLQPAPGSGASATTLRAVTYPAASASIDTQPRVPSGALSSRPATTTTRLVATMSSPGTNTGLIRIAPRPTPLVRLASTNNVVGLRPRQPQQPVPISPAPSQNQSVSVQMAPAQFQQVQPTSLSSSDPRMTNTGWMMDGRQVILAPVVGMAGPQSPPTGTMLSPKPVIQSPPSGYIQIMPRPAGATPVSFTSTPGQQQQTFSIVHSEPQGTQNTTLYTGAQQPMVQPDGRLVVPSSQPTNTLASSQFQSNLVVTSGQSAVKIQDDLRLTEAQLSSVQSLFQGANRVSRPEKAMIVSFIAGARGNPHPETGNTLRIHLSEYRERVLNQATGQLMDVAADTYLHMDYSTGTCEKVKYYRNEPPDVLLRLPVQPTLH
ncbi:hypothetical protein CSKR_201563 [Clonorchis sinensis]|uniref:Negative elongation factor A n=1 Tax=Clonorchis sinensis TaxID=79923 RepID=A0A8T1MSW3_CLOSI|nr:hypothetical protein CSKR_201563 [Clonorchis sinensis]